MPSPTNGHLRVHQLIVAAGLAPDLDTASDQGGVLLRWRDNHLIDLPGRDVEMTEEQVITVKAIHSVLGWSRQGSKITDLDILRIAVRAGRPLRPKAMCRVNDFARSWASDWLDAFRQFQVMTETKKDGAVYGVDPIFPVLGRNRRYASGDESDDRRAALDSLQAASNGERLEPGEAAPMMEVVLSSINRTSGMGLESEEVTAAAESTAKIVAAYSEFLSVCEPALFSIVENGVSDLLEVADLVYTNPTSGVEVMQEMFPRDPVTNPDGIPPELAALFIAAIGAAEEAVGKIS